MIHYSFLWYKFAGNFLLISKTNFFNEFSVSFLINLCEKVPWVGKFLLDFSWWWYIDIFGVGIWVMDLLFVPIDGVTLPIFENFLQSFLKILMMIKVEPKFHHNFLIRIILSRPTNVWSICKVCLKYSVGHAHGLVWFENQFPIFLPNFPPESRHPLVQK